MAVANWFVLPGGGARFAFARDATASLGAGGITAVEVGAAVLYLTGLAYVAVACLRRRRGVAFDVVSGAELSGHYSTS